MEIDYVHKDDTGYPANLAAEDTRDNMASAAGDALRSFPQELWVEPRNWLERYREKNASKTWGINYLDRYTRQGKSHECTTHSERALWESCWNRQRGVIFGGPQASVRLPDSATQGTSLWVAPLSLYVEANPSQWGGANCLRVMEIAIRRGFLPDTVQPREYRFKHQLHATAGGISDINQGNGPWVPVSRFPEGWQDTARNLRIDEVILPESIEQMVCLLLADMMIGVGRQGHAVPYGQLILDESDPTNLRKLKFAYPDSYNVTRVDSYEFIRQAVSGSHAVAAVTVPDDWLNPAGVSA